MRGHRHIIGVLMVIVVIFMTAFAFTNATLAADTSRTIAFQARILSKDRLSAPSGTFSFRFSLYSTENSSSALWSEQWTGSNKLLVRHGLFTVNLGNISALSTSLFTNPNLYLTIEFDSDQNGSFDQQFASRIPVTAVPYALSANSINGQTIDQLASTDSTYLTLSSSSSLTNERLLTGTTDQIILADGGANGALTLSLPQSINTTSTPTFGGLTVGSLGGVLKASNGVISGAATTDDLTEGSNQYFTNQRVDDRVATWAGSSTIATVGTITTGTWQGSTLGIAYGGTGQTSASAAINALVPDQTGNSGEYLTTNGTIISWTPVAAGVSTLDDLTDVIISSVADNEIVQYDSGSATWINQTAAEAGLATTSDLSGYQPTITWGDGLTFSSPTASVDYNTTNLKITAAQLDTIQSIATSASPTFAGLALGTGSITMTGSLGTTGARLTKGWFTDLEVTNAIVGSVTGNSATVTTNANLTGPITSDGNATSVASQTGTGSTFVMQAGPTLTTPALGDATYTTLSGGNITDSGLTATRVVFAGTAGILQDSANMTFNTTNGLILAAGSTSALQLSSTAGTAVGGILFGADTNLYRVGANAIQTDGQVRALEGFLAIRSVATDSAFAAQVTGDSVNRIMIDAKGLMEWGSGSALRDTNLYRSAADTLKTDDSLVIAGASADLLTQGDLRFYDADSTNYVGFQAPATVGADVLWTLPNADGAAGECLSTNAGVLSWAACGGGSGAPTTSQYLTLALDATLSAERVLVGTANQIILNDAGANGNLTLSTPQDIATTSSPTFAGLALGTGSITMTGSLGTTGARLTKGWFTDLEVTNAITGSVTGSSGSTTGNAATVTTNADLTGPITSVGNATSVASQTGTGSTFVMQAGPTLTTPDIGVATATSIAIGANTIDTNEWANLDGLNQTLATTSSPTFAGLALGTGSITMTGSLGTTGARLTKGWFTDLEVTNAIVGSVTGNSATVTTNANLTGPITSDGNATSVASQTGTGSTFVMQAGPTLTTPALGDATYTTLSGGNITDSGLTATRVVFAGTAGILQDSANMTFNTTNGLMLAAGSASALQLTSTAGTAAGGILFGADTTLYRGAANELHTDDLLAFSSSKAATDVDFKSYKPDTAGGSQFLFNTSAAISSASLLAVQNNGTNRLVLTAAGQLELATQGTTGGLSIGGDTYLYRSAAGTLSTTDTAIYASRTGAAALTANRDDSSRALHLYRASNTATDSTVIGFRLNNSISANEEYAFIGGVIVDPDSAAELGALVFGVRAGSEAAIEKMRLNTDGKLYFGTNIAIDTNLYRSAADTLKTDDHLAIAGVNAAGGSANALALSGTLGAFNGSDTFNGIDISYTNADHTSTGNTFNGINIGNITGDAEASEYAINIGSGWDAALNLTAAASSVDFRSAKTDATGAQFLFNTSAAVTTASVFAIQENGTTHFAVDPAGALIALATYSKTVGVTNRDLYIDDLGTIGYVSSSARYKTNINDASNTDWLYNLRPVTYEYTADPTHSIQIGLVAEEVENTIKDIFPSLVSYKSDDPTVVETVNYSQLIVPLLAQTQKLNTRLQQNELAVAQLQTDVATLLADKNQTVVFAQAPLFPSNTAGLATIPAGQQSIDYTFASAHQQTPVVTVSISSNDLANAAALAAEHYAPIVVNPSATGFTIVLAKPATTDVPLSWIALTSQP